MITWCSSFLNLYFLFSFPNQTIKEALPMSLRWTKLSVSTYLLLTSEINYCHDPVYLQPHCWMAKWSFTVQCFLFRVALECVCSHSHTHTFFSLYNYFDSAINKSCPKGPCRVSDMQWGVIFIPRVMLWLKFGLAAWLPFSETAPCASSPAAVPETALSSWGPNPCWLLGLCLTQSLISAPHS